MCEYMCSWHWPEQTYSRYIPAGICGQGLTTVKHFINIKFLCIFLLWIFEYPLYEFKYYLLDSDWWLGFGSTRIFGIKLRNRLDKNWNKVFSVISPQMFAIFDQYLEFHTTSLKNHETLEKFSGKWQKILFNLFPNPKLQPDFWFHEIF